ncbi:MAG: lytic transglycosylase domain-containing protein [Roseinatronobacter sp.]
MQVAREKPATRWAQGVFLGVAGGIMLATVSWPILSRAANPAQLCEAAARTASARHGVPLDVMRAIALVETGRTRNGTLEPWPWALNFGGPGAWAATREDALRMARARIESGHRNVDLGCFQVNFHWHGENFTSLDQMIDPQVNADYAARLLLAHKARRGTWEAAAGAYHSGTPALAERYIANFRKMLGRAQGGTQLASTPMLPLAPLSQENAMLVPAREERLPRENRFSLLQPVGRQSMGSLVPIRDDAGLRPLINLPGGAQ